MAQARIGVLGGSGLYQMPDLEDVERIEVHTPWGRPSDAVTAGTLAGVRVAFLPRHGRHHQLSPAEVPARANLWALKTLGVERVISVSAVGSLRETIHPLDLVVPDQVFDRTTSRARTFFDHEIVAHVSLADPFCPTTRAALIDAAAGSQVTTHPTGTYICIEGPQFSTKAESRVYRQWGMDIIGMTAMPEVRLAREAELCFAVLALVTDYDVWHTTEEPVSVATVIANLHRNVEVAQAVLRACIPILDGERRCACGQALAHAIVTAPEGVNEEARARLAGIAGRYLV